MLSSEFCEIVKNTIFTEHLGTPVSVFVNIYVIPQNLMLVIAEVAFPTIWDIYGYCNVRPWN